MKLTARLKLAELLRQWLYDNANRTTEDFDSVRHLMGTMMDEARAEFARLTLR